MSFERMTANEIRRSYAEAKYPKEQIKILADLNLCKREDIVAIIEHKTDKLPKNNTPKKPQPEVDMKKMLPSEICREIAKLYETGKYSTRKLADMFSFSQSGIYRIIKKERERLQKEERAC